MEKKRKMHPTLVALLTLALIIVIVLLIVVTIYGYNLKGKCVQEQAKEYPYKVTEIIDGEIIVLERANYVKLIGVNSPEKGSPLYEESKSFLEHLLLNKTVRIERDTEANDDYGRLLRYVFVKTADGKETFVNAEIVRQGFALPLYMAPNEKYRSQIERAGLECLRNKANLCGI